MQYLLLSLALVATASAFAPMAAPKVARTVVSGQGIEEDGLLGAQAPVGLWDPVGFTNEAPPGSDSYIRRRAVEIKHGRVCMLAYVGMITPKMQGTLDWNDGLISPSTGLKFSDIPGGLAAIGKVPAAGWAQILLFCGFIELFWWPASDYSSDYNYPWPWVSEYSKETKLAAELANGRLAMVATFGLLWGDGLAPGTLGLPTKDGIGLF
jgi:hypothetical protein